MITLIIVALRTLAITLILCVMVGPIVDVCRSELECIVRIIIGTSLVLATKGVRSLVVHLWIYGYRNRK